MEYRKRLRVKEISTVHQTRKEGTIIRSAASFQIRYPVLGGIQELNRQKFPFSMKLEICTNQIGSTVCL